MARDALEVARFAALVLSGPELEAWACRAAGMSYRQAAAYTGAAPSTIRRRTLRAVAKITDLEGQWPT